MQTLFTAFIVAWSLSYAGTALAISEGDMAPDFSLPVLGGGPSKSLSGTHGKVRYLDFWASWCAPCRVSIPEMIGLQDELGRQHFEVIAINVDEHVDEALRFLDRYPVNYDNLSDPEGMTAEAYALPGMPTSFVINPEGRVTLVHSGFKPGDMTAIRAHIVALLGLGREGGS